LYKARDQARPRLNDLDEHELASIASEGRRIAGALDEEGARVTVSLTNDRERQSRLASELQAESERIARETRWTRPGCGRRQARADGAAKATQADEHRRRAADAHDQLRELGGRHLYPWFEQHEDLLARGLAAELALGAPHRAVYHVPGAPGIVSLTAACLSTDRAIDLGRLERLVKQDGGARQRLLFEVAAELYGRERGVSLSELLAGLDGEDLDRVLEAIALVKRRRSANQGSPDDLWIRAAEPDQEPDGGSRSIPDA
jgi:hypothetical protein